MLLKVLHKPPRPIKIFMPKLGENHQRWGNNEIKTWGILKDLIPYVITWRLMLLKVLHKPPKPIRVHKPKLWEIIKERGIMKLKQGGFSRV
jgi:hypothetical protein